jgi:succinyl-diaminopimelate desuccinylase
MKSGVAALVIAVADHLAQPHGCRGVQVVLTAGEETGCDGALRIPSSALAGAGPLLVAEPTANRLVPAHKGAHWLRLAAHGRAAHGSAPELGDNAVVRLARAAVALHDHTGWPQQDGFGSVTANVGVLRGGVQPNVVPDAAELLLDIRTVPSATGDLVRDLVRSLAGDRVDVVDHVVLPPLDTDVDDPFVQLVASALRSTGLDEAVAPPARFFTDGSVLAESLAASGTPPVPTVVLGPGEPDQCHVADEWCSLTRVDEAVAVYAELLHRWCASDR